MNANGTDPNNSAESVPTKRLTPEAQAELDKYRKPAGVVETPTTIACDGPVSSGTINYLPGHITHVSQRCSGEVRWLLQKEGRVLQQRWIIEHYGQLGIESISDEWRSVPIVLDT